MVEEHEPTAVLTQDAYERLKEELERLTTTGRAEIAERLLRAREHGDIRENAEYDTAKNEQGLMEARIRKLEALLRHPQIVETGAAADMAGPGVLLTVRALDEDGDEETYLLAASMEERMQGARTVSVSSPFGNALLGKQVGDKVTYQAPGGTFSYEVLRLEPRP
ncbi:MAG TPA: transcription elongation factor GreA [Actinomycetota bacterium]|jgi:transcription elongation factor GreA